MRYLTRLSVVSGLTACAIAVAPAHALTIEAAFAQALRTNPVLHAARDGSRASHEDVAVARSAWRPTIEATAGASASRTRRSVSDPPSLTSDADQRSLALTYTQNVFRSGRDRARLMQATADVRQQHALVEAREQEVVLETAIAYLDVLRAERVVELRDASLKAIEARVRETGAQYRVGDRTRTDVAQAEAEREIATVEVLSARTELDVLRSRFRALVGLPPEGLDPAGEPTGLPSSLEEALEAARRDDPRVRAAVAALESSGQAVRVARAEQGPRVDLQASVTRTEDHVGGFGASDSTDLSTVIGARLTVPLYRGGAGSALVRRATHERAQRRNEHMVAIRNAELAAENSWRRLQAARRRHAAFTAAVAASREVLAGILREAEVGERTVREVLDAETGLVSNRVRALSAERDVVVEAYRLLAAAGRLTAHRLEVAGVPDLEREAAAARRNLSPGLLLLLRDFVDGGGLRE